MPLHTLSFPNEVASVLLEYVPELQLNKKVTVRMRGSKADRSSDRGKRSLLGSIVLFAGNSVYRL